MQSKSYNRDYYSSKNPAYADGGYDLESRRQKYADVVSNLINYCPEPWLDVGCGPGYLVHVLREIGYEAYGCDFSSAALQMVTDLSRPYIKAGDVRELPFDDGEFASSSAFHVLEHLPERDVAGGVKELYRITRERFYGIIPTSDGIVQRDAGIRKQITGDPTHLTIKPRNWWTEIFNNCGFRENQELERNFDRKKYGWVFVFDK